MRDQHVRVVGFDPGFRHIGWASVLMPLQATQPNELVIEGMGVVVSKAPTAKQKKATGETNSTSILQRTREISNTIAHIFQMHPPKVVTCESISYVRSSTSMCKIGACFGVLSALSALQCAPLFDVTPKQIKLGVTSDTTAAKEDVDAALDRMFADVPAQMLSVIRSLRNREHPYDALGSIVAAFATHLTPFRET